MNVYVQYWRVGVGKGNLLVTIHSEAKDVETFSFVPFFSDLDAGVPNGEIPSVRREKCSTLLHSVLTDEEDTKKVAELLVRYPRGFPAIFCGMHLGEKPGSIKELAQCTLKQPPKMEVAHKD